LQNQQAALNIEQGEQRMRLADMAEQRAAEAHRLDVQAAPSIQTQRELGNEQLAQDLLMNFAEQSSVTAYSKLNTTQDGTPEQKKTAQQWVMERADELERLERASPTFAGVKEKFLNAAQSTDPVQLMKEAAETYRTKRAAQRGASGRYRTGPIQHPETGLYYSASSQPATPDGAPAEYFGAPSTEPYSVTAERGKQAVQLEADKKLEKYKVDVRRADDTFEAINKDATEARKSNRTIAQMAAVMKNGLKTGAGAELGAQLRKLVGFFGGTATDDHEANVELFRQLSMDFVANRIAQTKGAVSDSEMKLFIDSIPTLSTSPEGIDVMLKFMKLLNDPAINRQKYATNLDQDKPDRFLKGINEYDALGSDFDTLKQQYLDELTNVLENTPRDRRFTYSDIFSYSKPSTPTTPKGQNAPTNASEALNTLMQKHRQK
jgi:hypothetical protein